VYWPQTPSVPAFLYADSSTINCDFNGDIRNIEGIELRDATDTYVFYDGIVGSEFDMMLDLDQLRGSVTGNASVIGGPVGSYMKGSIPIAGTPNILSLVPTFVGQVSGNAWLNPANAISTDPATYASMTTSTAGTKQFGPLLFSGMNWNIPPEANGTLDYLRLTMEFGANQGVSSSSEINVQLAIDGFGYGAVQTIAGSLWSTPLTFNFDPTLVSVALLTAGRVGFLVSGQVAQAFRGSAASSFLNSVQATLAYEAAAQRNFNVHFFNLMWEYSPPLAVYIPPPPQAVALIGYRWGSSLQVNVGSTTRTDILFTTLQLATNSGSLVASTTVVNGMTGSFSTPGASGLWYQGMTNGAPASFQVNVPVTGDVWAKVQFQDHIGAGPWSTILHIPQGNLIASDYLGAQGSVPPTVTNGNLTSGGLISYYSANASPVGIGASEPYINLASSAFSIVYPNGHVDNVPALYQNFQLSLDAGGGQLKNSTMYGFFPAVQNPLSGNPTINFEGPYTNYTGTIQSLLNQFQDGTVPITNGAFVVQTPAAGSATTGGGGGGTGGGANCATSERCIDMINGRRLPLRSIHPGLLVRTPSGRGAKVIKVELFGEDTVRLNFRSGLQTRCAYGHTLKSNGQWCSVEEILEDWKNARVWTELDDNDRIQSISNEHTLAEICRLHLDGDEHVYIVDGIWAHNTLVKNGS
jgi:hypothetical protein